VVIDGINIFFKRFPFAGTVAKIHRPEHLPSLEKLIPFLRTYGVRRLILEPIATARQSDVTAWCQRLPKSISLNRSPFLPTKTIRIDLTGDIENIFASFTEAKRRAVRRSLKLGVSVASSTDIDSLIRVKNASAGWFGFITTTGIRELWETFSPDHTAILLAYKGMSKKPIGGVLLLFWDSIAYYWIAGATKEGKKYFMPTLLAYEAMKLAKKKHARQFDFVGVWDERIPRENLSWKGFTKFKEGFGGKIRYYPLVNTSSKHGKPSPIQ